MLKLEYLYPDIVRIATIQTIVNPTYAVQNSRVVSIERSADPNA